MAEKNTAGIGFEKQIWDAACVLRGNIDASEYKSVVLGLIFLKYISDRFEEKYQELLAEGDGFEEDIDEYTSEGIFFVPANARWSVIASKAHTPEIGTVIDDAMRAIEKENKRLKDILPKNFARPELDKRRLGDVVDLFTNIQMIEHGSEKDILGRTYEYCLSKFAEQEGKLAGEFYTPSCVVRTLVEVLQPYNGRVYDPACGSGGMFVQSAKFIERHSGNINNLQQQAAALFANLYDRAETEVGFTEIIQIFGGGTPKTGESSYWNGSVPFFTPKDVGSPYTLTTEKTITEEGLARCNSRRYPVNTVFVTARGTVGKVGLPGVPMAMNQSCYALIGKDTHQLLVYFYTLKAVDRLKHKASGAVFDAITTRDFESETIMKLSDDDAKVFLDVAEPIYRAVLSNSIENLRLAALRDSLLPKLMSGEIDVSDIQL